MIVNQILTHNLKIGDSFLVGGTPYTATNVRVSDLQGRIHVKAERTFRESVGNQVILELEIGSPFEIFPVQV